MVLIVSSKNFESCNTKTETRFEIEMLKRPRIGVVGKGKGDERRIKMCGICAPTSHKECNHDVLQACSKKK